MDLVADDITQLLKQSETGDREAIDQLLERIYADLRQIARARLRGEHAGLKARALSGLWLEAS